MPVLHEERSERDRRTLLEIDWGVGFQPCLIPGVLETVVV
ncbi:conserved protein of unknown function [Limnospira indica PCC 8005]|uniref:Uncharacterized protein n=1 Tax=Limnospira indica PCC 8005 TaxID=376219 RepID=A0A9P1NW43_9CYAN|nr:conserved protein of unknown function [Limnospira indica PCC 8005]